ncbi:uncharacterized protein LOC111714824 [Eurytemora carolleeae]|uniref:uncharacterized protein LOC111714824 n=1 Tax=Eurytemora carolleeae TaxID=1294199 RepID=UPI000C76E437|nr:uncharacterized protein LOC111714824 [Eurytemora carolleeae]|eukprot:XP_023345795.1 uncharacterized protein LOC111714824 [Eurytemora affinis]
MLIIELAVSFTDSKAFIQIKEDLSVSFTDSKALIQIKEDLSVSFTDSKALIQIKEDLSVSFTDSKAFKQIKEDLSVSFTDSKVLIQIKEDLSVSFTDSKAFIQIKEGSLKNYLRPSINSETLLKISWSPDHQLNIISYYNLFDILERRKEWLHLWTIYSMTNSVPKGKYSFNLKQYCRVTIILKSFDKIK